MRSGEYWAERFEALGEAQLKTGEAYIQSLREEYDKAMAFVQRDVDVFYQRYTAEGVSFAEAQLPLFGDEMKAFKWSVETYIKEYREHGVDQRWLKELESVGSKAAISRLEALQTQIRQHVELLMAKHLTGTREFMGGIYKDNYYRSIFELQKGAGSGSPFAGLKQRQIDRVLDTAWTPDGIPMGERIRAERTKLTTELQTTVVNGVIRGDTSVEMAARLSERMSVSRSHAERLVMTEAAYFSGASRRAGYAEQSVEAYRNIARLDAKTSSICRGVNGTVYKLSEAKPGVTCAPFHAFCRTVDVPYFGDSVQEPAAQSDGKAYDVPEEMTYDEWARAHVSGAASDGGGKVRYDKLGSGGAELVNGALHSRKIGANVEGTGEGTTSKLGKPKASRDKPAASKKPSVSDKKQKTKRPSNAELDKLVKNNFVKETPRTKMFTPDTMPGSKDFAKWFNDLSVDEFELAWATPELRKIIEDRIRHPGGFHEWHLVSRAPIFKRWGVAAENIAEMRTLTKDVEFVNPVGKHGFDGSGKAHRELLEIIDNSLEYDTFKRKLRNWAHYRLKGGIDSLPEGLR